MKEKTCAFTGHRPQNLPFGSNEADERCIKLKTILREQIVALIEQEGMTHFIPGMLWASICMRQKLYWI